jgi:predicted RNA-binding Zn-ribbon protein involved in translation (DUF1610 family)
VTPVTDLERFFVQLVRNVAAGDRSRLGKPLFLVEIRNSILPYRGNRRALQLESSEEYEILLMRLVAGEGGFARTGPDEVHDEFVRQLASPHPDLTITQQHENAIVHLDPQAVAKALDPKPELAYAPPAPIPDHPQIPPSQPPTPTTRRAASQSKEAKNGPLRCSRCGGGLPAGRLVNFCPQCGQNLIRSLCSECKTELEPEWRHCVNCGAAVGPREGP